MQPIYKPGGNEYGSSDTSKYVSLYVIPPELEITLEELEQTSFNRLTVLREIETCISKNLSIDEYGSRMREILTKLPLNDEEDEICDKIGHFALRLAFVKQPTEQPWFIRQESNLLRYRLDHLLRRGRLDTAKILEGSGVAYQNLDQPVFDKYKSDLGGLLRGSERNDILPTDYYVVPFEKAHELFARRRCLVIKGNAFVYKDDLVGIVLSHFQNNLQKSFQQAEVALRNRGSLDSEERIAKLLQQLSVKNYAATVKDLNSWKLDPTQVSLNQIDFLAQQSFPPCMQNLHKHLRKNHKLKHMGRLHYTLFLKGIGLSLEECLQFWKSEFTQVIPLVKFEQEHVYNIRFNYGQEGKRANYTPYGCAKIIAQGSTDQPPDQVHGCPFKRAPQIELMNKFTREGISASDQADIFQSVKEKQCQMACKKYFDATHPGAKKDIIIKHPNQYFKFSYNYFKEKQSGAGDDS